jgi:hypothetical protein
MSILFLAMKPNVKKLLIIEIGTYGSGEDF